MPSLKTLRHQEVLFARLLEDLTQVRIDEPDRAMQVAQKRRRRKKLTTDGRLNILSADHPARRVVRAGGEALAMSDRQDFLTRIVRILSADAVDGIMATMDVLEELLLLHDLMQATRLPAFLNDKLMIVSLNRGGLRGSSWEMHDPITGPSPAQCAALKMDGVKMLWRNCDKDAGSLATMRECARAISEANAVQLPFFLEPLPMVPGDNGLTVDKSASALAQIIGVASALGDSSRYLWLRLPYCQDFGLVAQATTIPILLLGGETNETSKFLNEIKDGLASGHNVRGTMCGRNVLYPAEQDPVDVSMMVHELVHRGTTAPHD